jgi:multidrug efflux pump subunit AcrA (membrane-fusion protein)
MSYVITVEPDARVQFVTIERAKLNRLCSELSESHDDYTALGEVLEESKTRVATLEAELAEANKALAAYGDKLRDAEQSLAIERRNVERSLSQLRDANRQIGDLHAALANARRANVATVPDVAHVPVWSEKQTLGRAVINDDWRGLLDTSKADGVATQDPRPAIERAAYPDQSLAHEAGVSEPVGEGNNE